MEQAVSKNVMSTNKQKNKECLDIRGEKQDVGRK